MNVKRIPNRSWSIKYEARSFRRDVLGRSNPRFGVVRFKQRLFHTLSPNRITWCRALIQHTTPFMSPASLQTCDAPARCLSSTLTPAPSEGIPPARIPAGGCGMYIRCQQQSYNHVSINQRLLPIVFAANPQHSS